MKTEDEACGGPLRFYPLQPDKLIDAGNRTKDLDVVVSPAINCKPHFVDFVAHNCSILNGTDTSCELNSRSSSFIFVRQNTELC